jgi:hypothetical protein
MEKYGLRQFSSKIQLYLGMKSSVFNEISSRKDVNFPFWQKSRDGCPSGPDGSFVKYFHDDF